MVVVLGGVAPAAGGVARISIEADYPIQTPSRAHALPFLSFHFLSRDHPTHNVSRLVPVRKRPKCQAFNTKPGLRAHNTKLTTASPNAYLLNFNPFVDNFRIAQTPITEFSFFNPEKKRVKMSHESVWYSRPRTYGKGSRQW